MNTEVEKDKRNLSEVKTKLNFISKIYKAVEF